MKREILFFINIFCILYFNFAKDDFYLKNIILLKKDVIINNTIDDIIYKESQNAIDILVSKKFINTIPESEWQPYKKYLTNLDNYDNLEKFFLITKVWGIIDLRISNDENLYLISVRFYDIFDNYFYTKEFYLNKYDLLNNLSNYKDFLIENIEKYFKPINIKEYSKKLSEKRDSIKENKEFEVLLSGGTGFIITNPTNKWDSPLAFGVPVYINFDFSFKNFYFSTGFSHFSIFNEPLKIDSDPSNIVIYNDKIYTYTIGVFLESGGWFYNRFFLLSGGLKYNFEKIFRFNQEKIYNSQYNYYEHRYWYTDFEYSLLFIYLNFIFSPIKSMSLSFKIGGFLSPSNILEIYPSNLPFYIDINFKYFLYKDLFIELMLPFWIEGFNFSNTQDRASILKFIFQIGFGYKFKWDTKRGTNK